MELTRFRFFVQVYKNVSNETKDRKRVGSIH